MKVLFLGLAVSSLEQSQNLYSELILEFHRKGEQITLVAPEFSNTGQGLVQESNIQVIRVKTLKLFGPGKIMKGLANILLPWQYRRALTKSKIELDFDLVILPTPPITLISLAKWVKRKCGASVYLILRDIFPQNAVDLNLMREGSFVHKYFRKKEKSTYGIADKIGCMSQGNIDYVLRHNPEFSREKFHLLPNWGPLRELITESEIAEIKKKYGLGNKITAIYGGNLGLPQKVDNIITLAQKCQDIDDLQFLIIGEGTEKERLQSTIGELKLQNIKFIAYKFNASEYFKVLQAADIGLISLSEDFTIPNIPSKTLAYYNAKKPVLASIDLNTDFGKILDENKSGLWAEAGNVEKLKEKLLQLYRDKDLREEMGQNGYNYFSKELLTEQAYEKIVGSI